MGRTFAQMINQPSGGLSRPRSGERVIRYLSDYAAQLDLGGGKHAVVQSLTPIAATGKNGRRAPLNLSLNEIGGAFMPENSVVPVVIPKRLSAGVQLSDSGMTLIPTDASGASLNGTGSLLGQTVVYPNTQQDTDSLAKPTSTGFETYSVLRSVASPQDLHYRIGLPAGGKIVKTGDGSSADVRVDGRSVASVLLPNAADALGEQVPVSVRLSGDILTLHVTHRSGDFHYPIAVDPTIVDKQTAYSQITGFSNWAYASNNSKALNSIEETESETKHGFYGIEDVLNETFTVGQFAVLSYTTQGESKVTEFKVESYTPTPHFAATSYMGIAKSGAYESLAELPESGVRAWHAVTAAGTNGNAALYEVVAKSTGSTVQSLMYNTEVKLSQEKSPTISFETAKETIGASRNALYPGNWGGPNSVFQVTGKDPGIGVWEISFKSPNAAEWGAGHKANENIYKGNEQCRGLECEQTRSPILSTQGLPDGEDTIETKVGDAATLTGTASIAKVKVDWTAPHNLIIGGLPGSHEVGDGSASLKLTANATDGSGTTISSGIASIVLSIDGKSIGSPSSGCTPGPCSATGEWSIAPESYGAGEHTVTITVTDNAGNIAKEEADLTVHHATPQSAGPGSVNPLDGEFTMSATDVTVGSGNTALTVSRSYGSDHLTAGAEGPLGNYWSLSLAGEQSLSKTVTGNMVLTAISGEQSVFASNGAGGFVAPAGNNNMSLKEVTIKGVKDFLLTSNGATTTFAPPSGGGGSVWMPAITEGAGGTNAITYSFQTVSGVTEPTKALAPVPVGVSCSPTLNKGCRALTFTYAASTTATSEASSGWGDYIGRLKSVSLTAWDPAASKMTTTIVAQYSFDNKGKLRAEWDPRISPALKTKYGYDTEGHLTAVAGPGQEPWLLAYGINAGDANTGRLLSVSSPSASTALGEGVAPANTAVPTLSSSSPVLGKAVSVTNGTWSNSPLTYSYQWQRCASGGSNCVPIYGARNQSYIPTVADGGYAVVARVTAYNTGGAVTAPTAASELVAAVVPTSTIQFGAVGSGTGQFKSPSSVALDSSGNVWIADFSNNRVQKFSPSGVYVASYGTEGAGEVQFKGPWGLAIDGAGNLYISDSGNCRIEEISSAGAFVRSFGSCGSGNGQLSSPSGVALDPEGDVWVADTGNNRLEAFSPTGTYLRTVGSVGTGNGQFKSPRSIAFVGSNLYVTDAANNRVQEFAIGGTYIAQFGAGGTGNGQFAEPYGIAVEPLSGDLLVTDRNNNRVQQFTPSGVYVTKFGSVGTGAGQLKTPTGLLATSQGAIYVVDGGNSRVSQWWPTPSPVYNTSVGTLGSGNGQLNKPIDQAIDPMGNIWVTDSSNNRIEKFSPYGVFLAAYGSFGSGEGQFNSPAGIAINQSTSNVYVSDQKNSRVEEFSPSGKYIAEFGKGKISNAYGLAIDASGYIWVADSALGRVDVYSQSGTSFTLTQEVGKGELAEPMFIAFSGGNAYVTDWVNNRVQEFDKEGKPIATFGSKGTGNGQFEGPEGIATDPATGTLYVADTGKNRIETFSTTGVFLTTFGTAGTGEGQFKFPVGLAFSATGTLYADDYGNNRIVKGTAGNVQNEPPAPPSVGTTAVTTFAYKIPVHGTGAPYAMGSTEVATWGQEDDASEATAIFPPDEQQTTPASDYRRATLYYFDSSNRLVNVANPSGGISTSEYNSYNDVVRTLSAVNRETALKEGAKSIEASHNLDVQSTYENEGTELVSKLGPRHTVKLASGSEVQARAHTKYFYDEGAPSEGGPYHLVTKVTEGAQIAEKPEEDIRTTVTAYGSQENLGWTLRKPTSVTNDSSGLKLIHTTRYDRATGNVIESRTPGAGAATESASMSYSWGTSFGSLGAGEGQVSKPGAIARDSSGHIWVADTENNRVEEFSSAGAYMTKWGTLGTSSGQFKKPEGIAIDSAGHVWVADTGNNRLQEFNSGGGLLKVVESIEFQTIKAPTAIAFATGEEEIEGLIYVLETGNNRVVEIYPETIAFMWRSFGGAGTGNGQLKSPEGMTMDASGNLWVADTGNNRVQEFSATGSFIQKFGSLGSGNGQLSKPEGLTLDSEGNVLVADGGNNRVDIFSSRANYLYKFGTVGTGNGQMKTPAGVVVDSGNNAFVLDTANNRISKWTWAEQPVNGGTYASQVIYYTAAANSKYTSCGERPEWMSLICQTQPAEQPNTSGIPNLPVVKYTYNLLDEMVTKVETVGATTRTSTLTYDEAGRVKTEEQTSSVGTALPKVTDEYDSESGLLLKLSTTVEGKTKTVTSVLDKLGRLTSYTDADENTSSYTYDVDGRTETANDGKGTQTYSYDATTGAEIKLVDSAAGTFTGTYDVEGDLATVGYPNGMVANYSHNAAGEAIGLEYVKTTHCTSGCTWYSDAVLSSIHGQVLAQTSTQSGQGYSYDGVGRLTQVKDTPAGKGCTTRLYSYDAETNRTGMTTREPGLEGKCATEGGTNETHSYDKADRLTDSGVAYSTFGDITTLPAADAGGSELTSTYYVNNEVASQAQKGQTIGYALDPGGRVRETVSTGTVVSTVISHYSSADETPAWTGEISGKWERSIAGIDGGLVAVQHDGETPVLQLSNLSGDIVATAYMSETATGLASNNDITEFGVPRTSTPPKYSWLGAHYVPTELPSGAVTLGVRSYVPQIGRFLQPDLLQGGAANAYTYTNGDPVNESDLTGMYTTAAGTPTWILELVGEHASEIAAEEAAREAAARLEAEMRAAEAAKMSGYGYEGDEGEEEEGEEEGEENRPTKRHRGGGPIAGIAAAKQCISAKGKKCHKDKSRPPHRKYKPPKKKKKPKGKEDPCAVYGAWTHPGGTPFDNGGFHRSYVKGICLPDGDAGGPDPPYCEMGLCGEGGGLERYWGSDPLEVPRRV